MLQNWMEMMLWEAFPCPSGSAFTNDILSRDFSQRRHLALEMDAQDEDGNIVIRADLPGVAKEDLTVTLEEGVLTISAKREAHQREETPGHFYIQERRFGSISRSLSMPSDFSEDIHATLKDGVLQLTLKPIEGTKPRKPRKIAIS